jgi:hypothetical protein
LIIPASEILRSGDNNSEQFLLADDNKEDPFCKGKNRFKGLQRNDFVDNPP